MEGTKSSAAPESTGPASNLPRLVITEEGADGRSVFTSDASISDWVQRPTGLSVTEVWRVDSLPVPVAAVSAGRPGMVTSPAASGLAVRMAVFPPDADVDAQKMAAYEASMRDLYGDQGSDQHSSGIAGMHRTDTIDIITVVDGAISVLLDTGETLLRKGDTVVLRGNMHAWRNRSAEPCTLLTVVLPATREQTL